MKKFVQILCVILLLGVSFSASSKGLKEISAADNDRQTIELTINGDKYIIQNVNPNGRLDIYNIIGTKVITLDVKSGICDSAATLPKGYYIIKIDDSTRKIAVK